VEDSHQLFDEHYDIKIFKTNTAEKEVKQITRFLAQK